MSWPLSWGGEGGDEALVWEIWSPDFLVLTFCAFLKGCGFGHLLWTNFSSLHPDLPNWTIRQQFHFLHPRDWTNGNDSQAVSQLVTVETFTETFEWCETWCCASGWATYSSAFLVVFSLTWLKLGLRLTVLSWSQLLTFISPLIKWRWNYIPPPSPVSPFRYDVSWTHKPLPCKNQMWH